MPALRLVNEWQHESCRPRATAAQFLPDGSCAWKMGVS
jgi:hypothetical protein